MAKSAYSLILNDEVIREVDRQAGLLGTNRSALVNRILAESLSLSTPEKRLGDILDEVERALAQTALQFSVTSSGAMTLRTALEYKYNPSLHYTVELYDSGLHLGQLRAAIRTQNPQLLASLREFFLCWAHLEQSMLPPGADVTILIEQKRMNRTLRRPTAPMSSQQAAGAITDYVTLLDGCLKSFFGQLPDIQAAQHAAEHTYHRGYAGLGLAAQL